MWYSSTPATRRWEAATMYGCCRKGKRRKIGTTATLVLKKQNFFLCSDKNVIDRDMHQLHKVADEAHDGEADSGADNCPLVLLSIRLGALVQKALAVLVELSKRLNDCVNSLHGWNGYNKTNKKKKESEEVQERGINGNI